MDSSLQTDHTLPLFSYDFFKKRIDHRVDGTEMKEQSDLGVLDVRDKIPIVLLFKKWYLFRDCLMFDYYIIFCGHLFGPSSVLSWSRSSKNHDEEQGMIVV